MSTPTGNVDGAGAPTSAAGGIFLSYSRSDGDFAKRLVDDLAARGVRVWLDQNDIEPGAGWDRSVEAALDACRCVVVVLSPASVASDNVLDELTLAIDEGKELVPILLAECRAPLRLRRRQHIDFTGAYDAALETLVDRLAVADATGRAEATAPAAARDGLRQASIAVLPLRVLGDDADATVLAAGLHDEVITGLSRVPEFHVVAASTMRAFADRESSLEEVARELGVRYALTGSLARGGDRLRITVQLVETSASRVLWDDRFEADATDLFDMIDRITEAIVGRLHPQVFSAEIRRIGRKSAEEMNAWELTHRARIVRWSREGMEESVALLRRALELDADSALAHAELAKALSMLAQFAARPELLPEATQHARQALKIAPDDPGALVASCTAYTNFSRFEEALAAGLRAIEINPNSADAWAQTSYALSGAGRPAEALEYVERAMELSPRDPLFYVWHMFRARALGGLGRNEESRDEMRASLRLYSSNFAAHMLLAVSLANADEPDEARRHWAEAKALFPLVSRGLFEGFCRMQSYPEDLLARDLAAMERVGLE